MGRSIFADPNRVVSEDVDYRQLHQRAQAQRASHVVDEDEESRTERPNFHQTHSVQNRAHGVFADSEMEVSSGVILRREIAGSFVRNPGFR